MDLNDEQIEAIVARAIADEAAAARTESAPPSSAIVWWRAQMRARREAAQLADKPIAVVHALAIACGAGLALACVGLAAAGVRGSLSWFTDLYENGTPMVTALATAMLVSVLFVSVAALFVLRDE